MLKILKSLIKPIAILLFVSAVNVNAASQAERDFYGPFIQGIEKALFNQHDWFSHESMAWEIFVREANVPNRVTKKCAQRGTHGNQAVPNLDEICQLSAIRYWLDNAVPRIRKIAGTRQNHEDILYQPSVSYEHFSELGTSFRRELLLPSNSINSNSIDFRCIWALDAFMPVQDNPFLDTGRSLAWFGSAQNTGKHYYIEECRKVILNFASHIENNAKKAEQDLVSRRLIALEETMKLDGEHIEAMNSGWEEVKVLLDRELGKRLTPEDVNEVTAYQIKEKRDLGIDWETCREENVNTVVCPTILQYTNFRIRHISPLVDKISLGGFYLGMSNAEFYKALNCQDQEFYTGSSSLAFFEALKQMNTSHEGASNMRVLGSSLVSCRNHNMTLAGDRINYPVGFFDDNNRMVFLAFNLASSSGNNYQQSSFYKFTEALKKKYPDSLADAYGFPFGVEDMEGRMRDSEGGHLVVFNRFEPIVTLISNELVKAQPKVMYELLSARIDGFKDYRDDM